MISSQNSLSSLLKNYSHLALYSGLGVLLGVGATRLVESLLPKDVKIKHPSNQPVVSNEDFKKIVEEQLVRNIQFFGEEGQAKISDAFIVVAGVGGIGSHVVSAVIRSGVKKIRLIDPGYITPSLLNKHAFATREHVGTSKVHCCADFILKVFPHIEIETIKAPITEKNIAKLLEGNPSFVIDCMDHPEAKAVLIDHCIENKLKVVTAGETNLKCNPTLIQITDISDVRNDGIIRTTRMKLKAKGRKGGVKVIFSIEKPETWHSVSDKVKKDFFGTEIIKPTFGTMTAMMAYSVSSYVLCDLAGQMYTPLVMSDVKLNDYERIMKRLTGDENKRGVRNENLAVDIEDVYILVREVFEWTCVVTGKRLRDLELVRWNPKKKASIRNLVLMSEEAAKEHRKHSDIFGAYSSDVLEEVNEKSHKLEEVIRRRGPSYEF